MTIFCHLCLSGQKILALVLPGPQRGLGFGTLVVRVVGNEVSVTDGALAKDEIVETDVSAGGYSVVVIR